MSVFFKVLVANLVKMMLTWNMIKYVLTLLAKQTDNKLDDHAVELIDAIYKGDAERVKHELTQLQLEYNLRKEESK
jgi:hypothetical protein